MTDANWDELHLVENPAVEVLTERLGYASVPDQELAEDRESLVVPILTRRLERRLRELNPWISDANVASAVRAVEHPEAASLIEANELVHTNIVHTLSRPQDLGDGLGLKGRDISFIDFERPDRNEFLLARQFPVKGAKEVIKPDIVLFVNGLPIVVIECKSPTIEHPIEAGVVQLQRYQESEARFAGRGATQLFNTAQILISTSGDRARYGTVLTPAGSFCAWNEPYPLTLDDLRSELKRVPKEQDILFYGMLKQDILLDLIRNFFAFEVSQARTVKKLARYQQYRAVRRATIRIAEAKNPDKRGGVIWHTQGSGKSLTILWTCLKLRRLFDNPLVVIVTDRVDLDEQIGGTFARCGFPNPDHARSVAQLHAWLNEGIGRTILTTIQKFEDRSLAAQVLNESENVFVLVDEAHRTQYGNLAAKMRKILPNACFLGFTGTPIDRKDRSTRRVFGDYLDRYTIEEAERDGATVPILYESRMAELHVEGNTLDAIFERAFKALSKTEREDLKRKYATKAAIAEAPQRIEAIALDIAKHFEERIAPNGFKAQVVASSREAAVRYKEALDKLGAPESAVLISVQQNDPEHLRKYRVAPEQERELIEERFLKPGHPLSILVVCDKLITGFDAPIEQVMYLDKGPVEHALLQTIARVNRRAQGKDYGLIVDYWGVSRDLRTALGIFDPKDLLGALAPLHDLLPRLEMHHRAAVRFFDRVSCDDLEACLKVLEPRNVRNQFDLALRKFSKSMDMFLPNPEALRFADDLRRLGKIATAARNRFRDMSLGLHDSGAKARALIEEHIRASGVAHLLEPVSIFSTRFDAYVAELKTTDAKASEMEHALRHEINARAEENPVFYKSLKDRLEEVIEQVRQERLDAAAELKVLAELVDEARNVRRTAADLGFKDDASMAVYGMLETEASSSLDRTAKEASASWQLSERKRRSLADGIVEVVKSLAVIDWIHKEEVQRQMRLRIKAMLRSSGFALEDTERIVSRLMDFSRIRFPS